MSKRALEALSRPPSAPEKMSALLSRLTTGEGVRPSTLANVSLMRATRFYARQPVMYLPCIAIVAQGRKRGFLGGEVYRYDPGHYLVLSLPLPFECETSIAPDGGPMLGVKVGIDMAILAELLPRVPHRAIDREAASRAIASTPMDAAMSDATVRLLECMNSPADASVLGPAIVREITWRVLCGPNGDSLRALAAMHGRIGHIQRALQRIHREYATPLDVATLADDVAMSASAFHHHFRQVTATSPLQYLKSIRLHRARDLMTHDGMTAAEAAHAVGYESPSQFSREFKRFFGSPPKVETAKVRDALGLDLALA